MACRKKNLHERVNICGKIMFFILFGVKIKACFLIEKCCTLTKRFFMGVHGTSIVVVVQILK